MSIERARRDLSIDTIIRKKGSLYTEIFPFLSTSGLPKSVTMLVERHNIHYCASRMKSYKDRIMYLSSLPKGGISLAYKTKENHVFNFCHDILKSIRKIVCIFVSYSSL